MNRAAFLFLMGVLAVAPARADELPQAIGRVWIHSAEEDTGEIEVYRPADFAFPPSRGREGFEIRKGGVFVLHRIAPTDGIEPIEGRWRADGADRIAVTFPGAKPRELLPGEVIPPPAPRTIRIASCDGKILRVRKPRRDAGRR